MWYSKMYFPGRHEVIESDAFGTQGAPSQRKAFPFLESLLSFTELDTGKVAVALRCISDDLESLDRERMTNAMVGLGALAQEDASREALKRYLAGNPQGFGGKLYVPPPPRPPAVKAVRPERVVFRAGKPVNPPMKPVKSSGMTRLGDLVGEVMGRLCPKCA